MRSFRRNCKRGIIFFNSQHNVFGRIINENYISLVDSVTSNDINKAVELLLRSKPSMVVTGNAVNLVPSVADIQGRLK